MPSMTFKDAAYAVLSDAGQPMHYTDIATRALSKGLVETSGATPDATMAAQLAVAVKKGGAESRFARIRPGVYGLTEWVRAGTAAPEPEHPKNVRVPFFPDYDEVRAFLPAIAGLHRSQVTGLHSALMQLTGTPQSNLDWTDPDAWITERLGSEYQDAARHIWHATERRVNPRHMMGHWLLASGYDLVSDGPDGLAVTDRGTDFRASPTGAIVREIDEAEGILKLLALVAELGPAPSGDLMGPWMEYLARQSRIRSEKAGRQRLYYRLRNIKARDFIARPGVAYAITDAGLQYLSAQRYEGDAPAGGETVDMWQLIRRQQDQVRESIASLLAEMDPIAFEHMVKDLLEKMGYEDVEVTSPSSDGGVDVVGRMQMGITSVREVVQVKRHKANIRRPVLDQLRGSLYRFNAVRGTIITTSDFARGLEVTALEPGAPPITLINGRKLIDLMIEHEIGVRKKKLELLEVDEDAFVPEGDEGE